jgi:transcription-repair coupling factor (superfamily II helicase)
VQERLTLYKRLANCETDDELRDLQEELIDRFGALPAPTHALIETHRLRLATRAFGVQKLDASDTQISVQFAADAPIDPAKVIFLIQQDRNTRMAGPDRLIRRASLPDLRQRGQAVRELLEAVRA